MDGTDCVLDIIINDVMLTLHIASQPQSSKKLNIFDYNNKSIIIYIKINKSGNMLSN